MLKLIFFVSLEEFVVRLSENDEFKFPHPGPGPLGLLDY